MPEIIRGIEQGSIEWHSLRLGSVGGSSLNAVLAKGQGKMRQALLYQLAAEILSGEKTETYTNQAPAWARDPKKGHRESRWPLVMVCR